MVTPALMSSGTKYRIARTNPVSSPAQLRCGAGGHMIQVAHLSKTFGDVKAVDDITFDVNAGEIFAFLGPNGAGKTTTIQMLTTLLRPSGGSIRIDGLDPVVHPLKVRRAFGIVFQDPSLDSELTAQEN